MSNETNKKVAAPKKRKFKLVKDQWIDGKIVKAGKTIELTAKGEATFKNKKAI